MSGPSGCPKSLASSRLRIVPGTEQIRVIRGIRVQALVVLVLLFWFALSVVLLLYPRTTAPHVPTKLPRRVSGHDDRRRSVEPPHAVSH